MRSLIRLSSVAVCVLWLVALVFASATPSRGLAARGPTPSHAFEARAAHPQPSSGVQRRTPLVKRKQTPLSPAEEMSRHLCLPGTAICPLPFIEDGSWEERTRREGEVGLTEVPTTLLGWIREGFECVEFENDLTSCGGCGSVDPDLYDCTTIPNALSVSCNAGACKVHSCETGFTLADDGKTCVRAL